MRGKRIAQNILSNWMALAVSTAIGFFLAPFIVHRLGNVAYGVWVLVASLSAYMGLLDFGLRGAVMRFVSKGNAQGNHAEAQDAVSAALWIRVWISLAVFLARRRCLRRFSRDCSPCRRPWTCRAHGHPADRYNRGHEPMVRRICRGANRPAPLRSVESYHHIPEHLPGGRSRLVAATRSQLPGPGSLGIVHISRVERRRWSSWRCGVIRSFDSHCGVPPKRSSVSSGLTASMCCSSISPYRS